MIGSTEELFGALDDWAVRAPAQLALVSRGGFMSFDDLVGNIASAALQATRAGIQPGQLVVVVGNANMALIIALALMRLGCRVGYTRDAPLYERSGVPVDAVIVDPKAPPSAHRTITVDPQWFAGAQARSLSLPPPASSFSVIVASSGSTGEPKLIEKADAVIIRDMQRRPLHYFPCPQPRVLALFGGRTSANLHDGLAALTVGGTIVRATDRAEGTVIDTIQLFRPDYMTMAPLMLNDVLRRLDERPAQLHKVQATRVTGAYCSPQLQKDALARVTDEIVMTYGAVEFGFLAWGRSRDLQKVEHSVGRLFDDVEVAAFDRNGQRLPVGSEGEIWAKVPDEGTGRYLGVEVEKPNAFKNGWFRTGDIGMVDESRNLIIRGRATNVINAGASKVNPEVLEAHIQTIDSVVEVGVAGVSVPQGYDKVCAAVVSNTNPSLEEINAHLARRQARWPIQSVKYVQAIPRTDNGKIDRVALKRLCAEQGASALDDPAAGPPSPGKSPSAPANRDSAVAGQRTIPSRGSVQDVFDALDRWASGGGGQVALASQLGQMTYADFVGNIVSAQDMALRAGITAGQLVVVRAAIPENALILALALIRVGCRVGYTMDLSLYDSSGVRVDAVIAEPNVPTTQHRTIVVNREWFRGREALNQPRNAAAGEFSIIYTSSGSTGRPKLVELSHVALAHWFASRQAHPYLDSKPRFLSTMGSRRMGTLQDTIRVLTGGGVVIRPADYRATAILETIRAFRPDYLLTAPYVLNDLLRALDDFPGAIPRVRWLRISGAYCSPALRQAALDRLADEYIFSYGTSETSRVAWWYSKDVSENDRAVGRLVDGLEFAAFDDGGQRLPPGSEGIIRIKPPAGTLASYIGRYAEEQQAIKDGWFITGDIGMVDAERNLFIRGRATNVINLGGTSVDPEILEGHIQTMTEIAEVGVAGVDVAEGYQTVCAAVVSDANPSLEAINAHLARRKVPSLVQSVKHVEAVPRTQSGKIDRAALKRLCAGQTASAME